MARYETAGSIINDALVECGLNPTVDAFSSGDPAVVQMSRLITTCGRQLVKSHQWSILEKEYSIVTQDTDTGKYILPADFDHMIDQTGWSREQRVPVLGSVTPQVWQYLKGRNLVSSTIYAVFRETDGEFWLYPQPPDGTVPSGLTIAFEYVSRGWAKDLGSDTLLDRVASMGDLVLFDPLVITQMLKMRFKQARGQDSVSAQQEFLQVFSSATSQDVGAMNLNVANMSQPLPYLDMWRNTPDSGYGM